MEKFTEKELEIISNGLLCLIGNVVKAKGLVMDTASQNSIDDYMKALQALNSKVCKVARETGDVPSDRELRIEGVLYFSMLENETEEHAKERFWKSAYESGIIINDDCCSYDVQ
jgi:3-deoxy-D-arabino-heptulosonate 7-phosphate (DAHP) synthase